MNFDIECEREDDGRWLAEVPQLPGVLVYAMPPDLTVNRTHRFMLSTRRASRRRPGYLQR